MKGDDALAIAKKYTRDSLDGIGALKGAPCAIKSTEHKDGITKVVFQWTSNSGTVQTTEITIEDGTPIYVWEAGNTYHYGDLAIYESAFYRCIVENSDITFNDTKWNEIGSPDGNYDIVQKSTLLPARFTAADRKMYYSIEDGFFWLWNGLEWVEQQPKTITLAEIDALFE